MHSQQLSGHVPECSERFYAQPLNGVCTQVKITVFTSYSCLHVGATRNERADRLVSTATVQGGRAMVLDYILRPIKDTYRAEDLEEQLISTSLS